MFGYYLKENLRLILIGTAILIFAVVMIIVQNSSSHEVYGLIEEYGFTILGTLIGGYILAGLSWLEDKIEYVSSPICLSISLGVALAVQTIHVIFTNVHVQAVWVLLLIIAPAIIQLSFKSTWWKESSVSEAVCTWFTAAVLLFAIVAASAGDQDTMMIAMVVYGVSIVAAIHKYCIYQVVHLTPFVL